nr:hypothetical protein CFP56_25973 [Quercus suber]
MAGCVGRMMALKTPRHVQMLCTMLVGSTSANFATGLGIGRIFRNRMIAGQGNKAIELNHSRRQLAFHSKNDMMESERTR